jgi:diguanylate cyclase (GGDEF)-like protein
VLAALIAIAFAAALLGAGALAVLAARRGRRLRAAEEAVVTLARSWSEDGSSRGRLCAAARLVAGAELAFVAEPAAGGRLRVTAAAGHDVAVGAEARLDDPDSILARAYRGAAALDVDRDTPMSPVTHALLAGVRARSGHVRAVVDGGRAVAVLGIAWRHARAGLTREQEELVAALAGEAARAIERDAHAALLRRQARTDELTALPNRRAWDEAVARELARARRDGTPLCLALLDLDHFKAFNDLRGHQAGDAHLRRTAARWRRELRTVDVLARYGGEEFGILLPGCGLDEAREVVERVRAATPDGESASAGVVAYDGRSSAEALLRRADAALYRAKHAGRATTVRA